jgi:protein tyrosine phosphatase (PTP) superfamily phosphohydrolase (DUF442 family)
VLLLGGGLGLVLYFHDYPVHHFGVVHPGILYRCGQPDDAALQRLIDSYGLRTVVNLRGDEDLADWYVRERQFCDDHGLKLVDLPLAEADHIRDNLRAVLEVLTEPARQPVLVHCEAGSARTGYAIAAYRIAVEGWSYPDALAEAERYKFKPEAHLNPEYVKVLQELAAGLDWHRLSDRPDGPAPAAKK